LALTCKVHKLLEGEVELCGIEEYYPIKRS